jgi:hypothetical protein
MNGFTLPSLPIHAIQARLCHQISPGFALGRHDRAMSSDGRNQIIGASVNTIEAGVGQQQPTRLSIRRSASTQRPEGVVVPDVADNSEI